MKYELPKGEALFEAIAKLGTDKAPHRDVVCPIESHGDNYIRTYEPGELVDDDSPRFSTCGGNIAGPNNTDGDPKYRCCDSTFVYVSGLDKWFLTDIKQGPRFCDGSFYSLIKDFADTA